MEALVLLGAGASCGACCWLALGGRAGDLASWARLARAFARGARRSLDLLAGSTLVGALLGRPSWREASRALAKSAARAGAELDEETCCSVLVASGPVGGLLLSVALGSPLWLPLGIAAPFCAVRAWASRSREARRKRLAEEMPDVFRALSSAMGSGMTLLQSAEYAGSNVEGEAGRAFARLALRMRCGESTEDALSLLSSELSAPGIELMTAALTVSHRTGSPLGALFRRSAKLVERQGDFERLLAVKTAQVRLSVRVVCLLPAVMIVLLAAISPDYQAGLASPAGMACLLAAALLDGLAVAIIRRIVAGAIA